MGERDPRAYASQSTEQLTALLRQPGLPPQERQAIEAVLTARFAEELLGPQGRPGAPPGSPSAAWSPPGSAPSAPPQPAQPQHQPPPPAPPQHHPPPPGQPRQQPVGRPVWDPPPQPAPRSAPPSSPPPASAAQARSGKKPPWWAGLVAALAVGVGVAVVLFILGRLGGDSGGGGGGGGGGGNQPGYSTSCYTDFGVCYLPAAQPVGSGCFCTGPSGSDPGTVR